MNAICKSYMRFNNLDKIQKIVKDQIFCKFEKVSQQLSVDILISV